MAIRITGRKVKRSPDMDNIFVRSINITQQRNRVDSETPVYRADIAYQVYGVDDDGLRHYSGAVETLMIEDFVSSAAGNATRLSALDALEAAIADYLAEQSDVDSATVV